MTFNIRNSGAMDGKNHWPARRELWAAVVRKFGPDLLGVQEVLADQYDHLEEQFPEYTLAGVAREDGHRQGEWSLILFRRERFGLIESGNFWLSDSPAVPGSKSWDSACSRMCSWVRLDDRTDRQELVFANVHLDHLSAVARRESAKLLNAELPRVAKGAGTILTGDFNCTEIDEPYAILGQSGWIDSFRVVHPDRRAEENTYHEFDQMQGGLRIDWILHSAKLKAKEAVIDRTRGPQGQCPSDHDAVTAVLQWVDAVT